MKKTHYNVSAVDAKGESVFVPSISTDVLDISAAIEETMDWFKERKLKDITITAIDVIHDGSDDFATKGINYFITIKTLADVGMRTLDVKGEAKENDINAALTIVKQIRENMDSLQDMLEAVYEESALDNAA